MSPNFRQPEKAFQIEESLTQLQAWDNIDSDSEIDSEPEAQFVPAPVDSSSSKIFDSSHSDSEVEDNLGSEPELVESIHNLTPRTRRRFITWAGSWIANANANANAIEANRIPRQGWEKASLNIFEKY